LWVVAAGKHAAQLRRDEMSGYVASPFIGFISNGAVKQI
jgi:hypothetical protein